MMNLASGHRFKLNIVATSLSVCGIGFVSVPKRAYTQAAASVGVSAGPNHMPALIRQRPAFQALGSTASIAGRDTTPSARRHVLIGAGVGAAIGAILGVFTVTQDKSGYFDSWYIAAATTLVGASTGALVGFLVYLVRR